MKAIVVVKSGFPLYTNKSYDMVMTSENHPWKFKDGDFIPEKLPSGQDFKQELSPNFLAPAGMIGSIVQEVDDHGWVVVLLDTEFLYARYSDLIVYCLFPTSLLQALEFGGAEDPSLKLAREEMQVITSTVVATTRKLKTKWTVEDVGVFLGTI